MRNRLLNILNKSFTVALANLRFSLYLQDSVFFQTSDHNKCYFYAFTSYLESVIMSLELLLTTGDFNIHVDHPCDPDCARFLDIA